MHNPGGSPGPGPIDERFDQGEVNQDFHSILERVSDAFVALDTDWRYTYVNEKAARLFGRRREDLIGKHIWTEFPEGIGQPFYQAYYKAVETQQPFFLEEYYPPYERWFENRIYPSKDGLSIFFTDITGQKMAEQELRESQQYNRMLFELSPIGLALCRMDGSLVDVNPAFAAIIGRTIEEALKLSYWDLTPEQYTALEQAQLESLEKTGRYGPYEKKYIHRDGHLVPVRLSGLTVERNGEQFILSSVEDISERVQAEEALLEMNKYISILEETLPVIIYIYDLETQSNVYLNRGIERLLNCTPHAIREMGAELFSRLIHPADLPAVTAFQSEIALAGDEDILEIEYRMRHANGEWRWLHSFERPLLRNADGTLKQKIGLALDITERKEVEDAVLEERNFSEAVLESLPGIFYMYDESLIFSRWNKNFEKVSGYTGEELARMTPLDLFAGAEKELLAERIREVFRTGSTAVEANFISKDGSSTPYFFTGQALNYEGKPYLVGVGIDIQERKRVEETLSRNEQILRLFVEYSPAAIAMLDREMRYIVASRRYLSDYHLGDQDLVGRCHYEVFPEIPERWKEVHRRYLAGAIEKMAEDPFPRADGSLDWIHWEIHPWYEKEGQIGGVILFSEVITERKQAEAKLREQAAILDLAHVIIRDLSDRIIYWNSGAQDLYGWTAQEAMGKILHELLKTQFSMPFEEMQAQLFETGEWEGELTHQTRDGRRLVLASHQVIYKDQDGTPIAILEVNNDITAQKRAEEEIRKLNAELEERVEERTAQLQAANQELEAFSYSVSHDLRAPLRAISGFSSIVARRHRADLNEEGRHYLDNIVQASERMGRLIDDLLTYSRLGRTGVRLEPVPLATLLADLVRDLQGRLDELRGTIQITADLPVVLGDQTLLRQIFTNVLENAVTYRKPDIPPRIEIHSRIEDDQVTIAVKDNGIGILSEHHDKIFNVFQRLHSEEEYPGTGIGLATVKKSVELLGGSVWVQSQIGEGSTFFIQLNKG